MYTKTLLGVYKQYMELFKKQSVSQAQFWMKNQFFQKYAVFAHKRHKLFYVKNVIYMGCLNIRSHEKILNTH